MSKPAFAGEQEAARREIRKRRSEALADDFRSFQRIAALVDHSERQGPFEIPLLPKIHEIVAQRAVLERDFVYLDGSKGGHEVRIFCEIDPLSSGVAAADMQPDGDARQRGDQFV